MATTLAACCCGACIVYEGDPPPLHPPRPYPQNDLEDGIPHSGRRCHRLFVYDRRTVVGDVMGGSDDPDFTLKTNYHARRFEAPSFAEPVPFETTQGSGILLDAEPYWWPICQRGGWDLTTQTWAIPTLSYMEGGRSNVLADGTYTLLVVVEYYSVKASVSAGGASIIDPEDGWVTAFHAWYQQH